MRKQTCLYMLTFMLLLVGMATCSLDPIPFNVTVGYPFTWKTESFTNIAYTFLTEKTSGLGVYTDLSDSKEFSTYSVPSSLNGYELYGVFQVDMQKVILPSGDATFSFTHDFSFGILNVNPKQLCIVGVDVDSKKFVQVDFVSGSAPFTQQLVLPLQTKVYTLGIMAVEKEIPAQFGVPTMVNYRASLKYELHKDLNQYLSAFVNRPLSYPAYEYTAKLVDNQLALPSNQMVEIASFSFNPMFKPSYNGRMVVDDFMLSFDLSKGFVDKNGKKTEIDFMSLQCLYVLDEKQGFVQTYGSVVFPGWQQLACSAGSGGIGANNFFPKYVTIVANLGSTPIPSPKPVNSQSPPQPITSKSTTPTYSINAKKSHFPRNGAFSVNRMTLELILVVMMVACLLL